MNNGYIDPKEGQQEETQGAAEETKAEEKAGEEVKGEGELID